MVIKCCSQCERERKWRTLCDKRKGNSPYEGEVTPITLHKYQIKIEKLLNGPYAEMHLFLYRDGELYDPGSIEAWTNKLNEIIASGECHFTNGYVNSDTNLYVMLDSRDDRVPIPFEQAHVWRYSSQCVFKWTPTLESSSINVEWYDDNMVNVLQFTDNVAYSDELDFA